MTKIILLILAFNIFVSADVLIGHWKMNDDAASTTVVDETGNHDGTAQQDTELFQVSGSYWHPFITSHGTLLEGFEDVSDWVKGANGTIANDTTNFKQGAQSIKVNVVEGNACTITKTVSLDLSSGDGLSYWLYVLDKSKLTEITLYISSAPFTKYFKTIVPAANTHNGWNHILRSKAAFSNTGGESWDNTMTRIRFIVTPVAAQDASVNFDDFRFGITGKAKVIITFDDNHDTHYNTAYPIMEANGQAGVEFSYVNAVDTSGKMSLAEMQTLRDAGWDISNHGTAHIGLAAASQEDMEDDIDGGYDWLVANGFEDSARFFAYPGGSYDDAVITKLRERHILARVVTGCYGAHFNLSDPGDYRYTLGTIAVSTPVTTTAVQAYIDKAISKGGFLILLFHSIVDANPSAETYEYLTADFQTISDYLKTKQDAGDLEVITFGDYYNELIANVPKINGSFGFNGTDDYIDIGNQGSDVKSIAMWCRPDAINVTDYLIDLNGTDYITIVNGTVTQNGFATGTQVIYVDGIVASTVTANWHLVVLTSTDGFTASDLDIGRLEGGGYFDGLMDNVMIFSKELTPDEIKRIYNNGHGTEILAEVDSVIKPRRYNTSPISLRKRYEF